MSELMVTITITEEGDQIRLPYVQLLGVNRCIKLIRETGAEAMWHAASCDCCFIVHAVPAQGEVMHSGYVVGPDGGWTEHPEVF